MRRAAALLALAALALPALGCDAFDKDDPGEVVGPAVCRDTIGTYVVWVPCPPPDTCARHHHDDDD